MHVSEGELKEFIADSGLVSKKEIAEAESEAKERGESLADTLVSRGSITEDALRRIQSYVLGIPFVTLQGEHIPIDILALIPEPVARTRNIVAFKKNDGTLEVAMLDVADFSAIDSVRMKTGLTLLPRLTDTESIRHALLLYQKALKKEFGDIISNESRNIRAGTDAVEDLKRMAEDLPVVRIVDTLLRHAIVQGASDIHVEPLESELLVRYRIDGFLHDAMTLPKTAAAGIVARLKILASLAVEERLLPQDGRFVMETDADRVSLRVSILPTFFGEKVVLRLLRETGEGFTLETLGFHGEGLERVHAALSGASGLIVVAGPAGSGKTTTLYTMLDILNTPDANLSTIEDPIEYQMKRVNQTQVNPAVGFTYAAGLRALMRQDADIIMVGEIEDEETTALAMNAALAGRLVLSCVTAPNAAGAITRLLELGADPSVLASTLRLVVGERLVRKLCTTRETYSLNRAEREGLATEKQFSAALSALRDEKLAKGKVSADDLSFYRPAPSTECEDGYKSRLGLQEVLTVSPILRDHMVRGDTNGIASQAHKESSLSLLEDGLYKAARGLTSIEEVLRVLAS